MAKAAPKGNKPAAKAARSKNTGSAAPKAAKTAAKPAAKAAKKQPAKAAKNASKTAKTTGKPASAASSKVPVKRGAKAKAKKVNKGDQLYCEVCGLVVSVDDACGCAACDIICCDTQMQVRN